MYHFVADPQTPELRLSQFVQVSSRTTQYLKSFQLEATQYLYEHLLKREFCIFNDESGLGKCATISALLSALTAQPLKKTLIVVQNDEQRLVGWEFHLSVLTDLGVCVLQNNENTTDSPHSVYLAKWSVLRSIGDLSKLKFDYVIVDHRGLTLNNNFCSSMLIKHFEKRVNIVVSSVDVTSDLKLLHNILRLGGRLEHKFKHFNNFEKNFRLPEAKEVFSKKVDLEEYFRQREILSEYIKDFRLRRYRHQFEQYLPLVAPEQYKKNLTLWLASNNSNSTLSGSTTASTTVDLRSTAGTEEIIECLLRIKHERLVADHIEPRRESMEVLELSDDPVAMSPLIFESSESDVEITYLENEEPTVRERSLTPNEVDVTVISSEEIEPIAPRRSTRRNGQITQSEPQKIKVKTSKVSKAKNVVRANTPLNSKCIDMQPTTPQRRSRRTGQTQSAPTSKTHEKVDSKSTEECTPKTRKSRRLTTPYGVHSRRTRGMERFTRSAESKKCNKYMNTDHALIIDSKKVRPRRIKTEPMSTINKTSKTSPHIVESAKISPRDKKSKQTKETMPKERTRTPSKGRQTPKKKENGSLKDKPQVVIDSQLPILNCSPTPEYEEIQCGQRLPHDLKYSNESDHSTGFRIPSTPISGNHTNLLLPTTVSMFSELDLAFVPNTKQSEVVLLSSSQDEGSASTTNQSRRTRALKRRRNQPRETAQSATIASIDSDKATPSFGELLARQRSSNKSPDLFSVCSDVMTVLPGQQNPQQLMSTETSSPFEGFKIFGSEVKQFQQQHAKNQQQQQQKGNNVSIVLKKKRERSCLNLLEKMFEPRSKSTGFTPTPIATTSRAVMPIYPPEMPRTSNSTLARQQQQRQCLTNNDDDDIFDGEFGGTLRLNSSGEVSPVPQTQQMRSTQQHNKITNYFSGTPDEVVQAAEALSTPNNRVTIPTLKKSHKSTQSTKLTRWFATSSAVSRGGTTSAPATPNAGSNNTAAESARLSRRSGPTKRKRLDLFKQESAKYVEV